VARSQIPVRALRGQDAIALYVGADGLAVWESCGINYTFRSHLTPPTCHSVTGVSGLDTGRAPLLYPPLIVSVESLENFSRSDVRYLVVSRIVARGDLRRVSRRDCDLDFITYVKFLGNAPL
jgi:hypothetical protein